MMIIKTYLLNVAHTTCLFVFWNNLHRQCWKPHFVKDKSLLVQEKNKGSTQARQNL